MTDYILRGKIMPFGGTQDLQFESRILLGYGDTIGPTTALLRIRRHQFEVEVSADDRLGPSTLANNVRSAVAHIVDGLGLLDGHARDVALLHVVKADSGEVMQWAGYAAGLDGVARFHSLGIVEVMEASRAVPQLDGVLADLRHAVSEPWDTGFYCYRALESMRSHWTNSELPPGSAKDQSWRAMREALHIDRAVIDAMKPWADPQRHGERLSISGEQQDELLWAAAEVVCRFIRYVLGGEAAMSSMDVIGVVKD